MVELALWTHNIVSDLQPQLLGKEPSTTAPTNGGSPLPSDESNLEPPSTNGNGKLTQTFLVPFIELLQSTLQLEQYSAKRFRLLNCNPNPR